MSQRVIQRNREDVYTVDNIEARFRGSKGDLRVTGVMIARARDDGGAQGHWTWRGGG